MRSSRFNALFVVSLCASAAGQSSSLSPSNEARPAPADAERIEGSPGLDGGAAPALEVALDDIAPGAGDGDDKFGASPHYLGFVASNYYPPADERVDPLLLSQVRLTPSDGRPAPTSYAFVMFQARITDERLAVLEALGCRVLGRHPFYAVKVALPPERIDEVAALEFVRWIGAPRGEQKLHPSLLRRAQLAGDGELLEMYVSVYESDLCEASREELTALPQVVGPGQPPSEGDASYAARALRSNGWQQRALEAAGLEVGVYDDARRTFRVAAGVGVLEQLAQLDFVQFVEEVPLARPLHDESMAMIMADSSRYYVNGNSNIAVTVGELDSGISTAHWDLAFHLNGIGWDFSGAGTGAWVDPCGHGTHVCGTMAGDGTVDGAKRGAAPGLGANGAVGRFFNARIFMGCGTQTVDFAGAMSVMRNNYQSNPRPMVVNNSWGSSPSGGAWTGSEYDARILDDEVYWQNQLYVFAAGNDGPTSGTVGLQAGAKNAFAVGSVDNYRSGSNYPGVLSSFSSRGRMADLRWKPNAVAPGGWIRSLQSGGNGYVYLGGTSMAAPHVSGVAAQMCDTHAFLRNAPARLASTLMASAVTKDNAVIVDHSSSHLSTYGAGRVEAFHANFSSQAAGWTNWGFALGAGQGTFGDIYVPPGCARVVFVMSWNEQASSAGASQAVVNDWDLYIDREPFTAGTNTGEYNAGLPSRNNHELRTIENPPAGWYRWKAHPYNATTAGKFGVTTFLVYSSTTPNISLQVGQSTTYALPGQAVNFSATVTSPSYLASAAHLEVDPVGGTVIDSWRYLNDGAYDDLTDNVDGRYECQLGDIIQGNSRSAYFNARWWTDGWKQFDTSAYADNTGFRYATNYVLVDGTPPTEPANVASTTHPVNAWSCESNVQFQWDDSFDAGVGVVGYSYEFDQVLDTIPDTAPEIAIPIASVYAPDSLATYYFHVRAIDALGNASTTFHAGPYSVMTAGGWSLCTPKLNSQFCLPTMSMTGRLSATGQDDLHLLASNVINNKSGLLFWGFAETAQPFQGGLKCVAQPTIRTGLLASGGNAGPNDCSGVFDFAFTRAYANASGFNAPGSVIFAQYWYRDPGDSFGTGLSDAMAVVMCE